MISLHFFVIHATFTAPNRAAVAVGTFVGSLLLIFILMVFLGLFYWRLNNRHHYEKEFSNEIRYTLQHKQRQLGEVNDIGNGTLDKHV